MCLSSIIYMVYYVTWVLFDFQIILDMNLNIITSTLIVSLILSPLHSQTLDWFQLIGSPARDAPFDLQLDRSQDIVITGFYEGGPAFFGSIAMTHHDGSEFFLAKVSPQGEPKWITDFSGIGFDRGDVIAIDNSNRIFLGGLFTDSLVISSEPDSILVSSGANDAFLMSFDDAGKLLWTRTFGGPGSDICYGLYADDTEILITGHYNDTIGSGLDGTVLPTAGQQDIFLTSFSPDGTYSWIKRYGGSGYDRGYHVSKDLEGNIIFNGYFSDTVSFGNQMLVAANGFDAFICKTNPKGEPVWARSFPCANATDQSRQFTMDPEGNIYLIGYFSDSIILFDHHFQTQQDNFQGYIVPMDPAGNYLWAKTTDGPHDNFFWSINYADGMLLIVGTASDRMEWDGQTYSTGDLGRGFVTKIDAKGNVVQSHFFGSSDTGTLRFFESSWSANDEIFVSGTIDNGVVLEDDTVSTYGNTDIFLGRIRLGSTTKNTSKISILFATVTSFLRPSQSDAEAADPIQFSREISDMFHQWSDIASSFLCGRISIFHEGNEFGHLCHYLPRTLWIF